MHATLAYLNAAGRRATRLTPRNCAFMQVMDTLLANTHGASHTHGASRRNAKSPSPIRKGGKAG